MSGSSGERSGKETEEEGEHCEVQGGDIVAMSDRRPGRACQKWSRRGIMEMIKLWNRGTGLAFTRTMCKGTPNTFEQQRDG